MDLENLLVVDCESTAGGEDDSCEPIEIAYYLVQTDEVKSFTMCPEAPCLPSATVIHGLSDEYIIANFKPISEVLPKVYEALVNDINKDTYVLAYNAPFDISCIHRAFEKYLGKRFAPKKVLDLLRLAQKIIPIEASGNHRLDTVYYFLFRDKLAHLLKCRQEHSGAIDVTLEAEVLEGLWSRAEALLGTSLTIVELAEYTERAELIEMWPMGKHKGDAIATVVKKDRSYINWFLKQDWCNNWKDLVFTLSEKHGIHK